MWLIFTPKVLNEDGEPDSVAQVVTPLSTLASLFVNSVLLVLEKRVRILVCFLIVSCGTLCIPFSRLCNELEENFKSFPLEAHVKRL